MTKVARTLPSAFLSLLFFVFCAPNLAFAQGHDPTGGGGGDEKAGPSPEKTLGDYFQDLDGDNKGDRLAAARVLRGMLRRNLLRVDGGRQGSLAWDEARSALFELETRIPSACLSAIQYDNVIVACADMLVMLGVTEAIEPLRARMPALGDGRRAEKVAGAVARLEALPKAESPASPASP